MNTSGPDAITLDCTNTYREICALNQNIHDGIIYWTRKDFLRRVYTLHRDFHRKALVILFSLSMQDDSLCLDIDEYWKRVQKERRDLAEIYVLSKSNTLCALIKRKIYGGDWWKKVTNYMSRITNDWAINLDTSKVFYYPIEDDENNSNSEQSLKDIQIT